MLRNRAFLACLVGWAIVAIAIPQTSLAHHSHASLNIEDVRLYQGVVSKYSWRAPHVFLRVNVVTEDGSVKEYMVEALNPPAMKALGWSKETFKPGDLITWEGPHDKDPDRPYAGINWAETPGGDRLLAGATDFRKARQNIAASIANVPVEPVMAIGTGSWTRISADGSPHRPIRKPATDWPLTEAAEAAMQNWSEDENPMNNCVYAGPPRNIVSLSNFKWSRPDDDKIIIDRDMWDEVRVIHLSDAAPRGEPSSFGYSVGRFEGDELIVETDNFIDEPWGMYTGIDSTAQKKLTERYWLSDDGLRLNVRFTVQDPGVLTAPYTYTHQWKRVPDRDLVKAPCSLESAWLYKTAGYSDRSASPTADRQQMPDTTEETWTSSVVVRWLSLLALLIVVVAVIRRKNPGR